MSLQHFLAAEGRVLESGGVMRLSVRSRRRGFTLIEVLIVVLIIAVLASILIPAVANARRVAKSTNCLSNLRQVGMGFVMYARDNQGMFPIAVHRTDSSRVPTKTERRWYDQMGPYVNNTDVKMTTHTDVIKARGGVIWGCPEWQGNEFDPTDINGILRPGYGMNYYPTFIEDGGDVTGLAHLTNNN